MGLFSRSAKQAPEPVEDAPVRQEEMSEPVEASSVGERREPLGETVEFVPPEGDGESEADLLVRDWRHFVVQLDELEREP